MNIRAWRIAGTVAALAALAALVAMAAPAVAAVHGEVGDAPDLPPGQITNGSGLLVRIHGTIVDSTDVDLYCVNVLDAGAFSATVVGGAAFDTQLFLFWGVGICPTPTSCPPPPGTGIVHDDDTPPGADNPQSTITGAFLSGPTPCYLAISAFNRDPVSAGGLMWSGFPSNTENAPDGPGAANTLIGWTGFGDSSGDYWILLTGCEACDPSPQPGTWLEQGDAPDDLAAQSTTGSGSIDRIFGDFGDGNDVDGYRIRINDPATFSAVSSGPLNQDTELSLFASGTGNGVTFDDDDLGTLFSRLSGASIPSPGIHTLYIAQYDRMAAASGSGIWEPLPANFERGPDGPGAPGPLSGWIGAGLRAGYYGIRLMGAELSGVTDVPWRSTPAEQDFEVHPNPFQSDASVQYRLGRAAPVTLRIFDLRGGLVRTLVEEQQTGGDHSSRWDGRDGNGRLVPAGVYTVRLESPGLGGPAVRRVVLIR